jgi:hypothetical protein
MNPSKLAFAALVATSILAAAAVPALQDMAMPTPTEQHKQVLMGVGDWEGTITSYMTPGETPQPMPAREKVSAIGEFWILSHFECEFMGMPYHGSGHYGYDVAKKKYVGTWVDSMSSYLAVMEGDVDPKSKALVMRWQAPDMTGKMTPHRSESIESGDKRTMTFYTGDGAGTKSMVIEMKRKGGKPVGAGAPK